MDKTANGCCGNPTRRHVGRAARRRRRKLKEIQRVEQVLRSGTVKAAASQLQHQQAIVLPVDRSRLWPAVLQHRSSQEWSFADEAALTGQLGYLPGNVIRIAARVRNVAVLQGDPGSRAATCEDTLAPVVAQLYPIVWRDPHEGGKAGGRLFKARKRQRLQQPRHVTSAQHTTNHTGGNIGNDDDDNVKANVASPSNDDDNNNTNNMLIEPFPTTYWLTHPFLRCLVSKLELEGYGMALEQRLAKDRVALASMHRAHATYGQERWQLLTASDVQLIRGRQWDQAFSVTRGVAGISNNYGAVKCLHAHAAHFLSGGAGSADNCVGMWVMQEVERRFQENR